MSFAKGPVPGATPKAEALRWLPAGSYCRRETRMGITGYIVYLPTGQAVASAGNAQDTWQKAGNSAQREALRLRMPPKNPISRNGYFGK